MNRRTERLPGEDPLRLAVADRRVSSAFVDAVLHAGTAPAGWLWVHSALAAKASSEEAIALSPLRAGSGRSGHALEQRLTDVEGAPIGEILQTAHEFARLLAADIDRITSTATTPDVIRLDHGGDGPREPSEWVKQGLLEHFALPMLYLELGGVHVSPTEAWHGLQGALDLVEAWVRDGGLGSDPAAAGLWEAVKATATEQASLS